MLLQQVARDALMFPEYGAPTHIAEPLQTLQRFLPFLAEDGLVAISVPKKKHSEARKTHRATLR